MVFGTLESIIVLIIVVILIIVLLKFLFNVLAIAPIYDYQHETETLQTAIQQLRAT